MRTRFTAVLLGLGFLASAALSAAAPPPAPSGDVPIYPLAQVKQGLEGTGYTVLEGRRPTTFSVKVQGVLQRGAGLSPMIVCRVSGAGLGHMGVLEAMSGSPVYVKGRLLGAVAFAWPFSKESLCGVTPASALVALGRGKIPPAASPGAGSMNLSRFLKPPGLPAGRPGGSAQAADWESQSRTDLFETLDRKGFRWSLSAESKLGKGAAEGLNGPPPAPGDMVAVQLVSGDVQFAAFGTLAWVDGNRFVAFGHPFLNLGRIDLPVARADVVALIPSVMQGMKLSNALTPIGAARIDAQSGVAGFLGVKADTLPVTIRWTGTDGRLRTFHFQAARNRLLTPGLVQGAIATLAQNLEGLTTPGTVLLKVAEIAPEGHAAVHMNPQAFYGHSAFSDLETYVSNLMDLLINNPYQHIRVNSLTLDIQVHAENRGHELVSAWVDRDSLAPGDPLVVTCTLRPSQAPARRVRFTLNTSQWPTGKVQVWVGDPLSLEGAVSKHRDSAPDSAAALLRFLARLPDNSHLAAAVLAPGSGLAVGNRRLGSLPPSTLSLLDTTDLQTRQEAAGARLFEFRKGPRTGPLKGLMKLTVTVKKNDA